MCSLRERVDYGNNAVVPRCRYRGVGCRRFTLRGDTRRGPKRELGNKIDVDSTPPFTRNIQRLQESEWEVVCRLRPLTDPAALHPLLYRFRHAKPIKAL